MAAIAAIVMTLVFQKQSQSNALAKLRPAVGVLIR
jgi:hypothetical protein